MGGAATLVLVVILVSLALVGSDDSDTAQADTAVSPRGTASSADELRSHMPQELRSLSECQEADPASRATTAIQCQLPSSNVPSLAVYELFSDTDSMNAGAEEMHKRATSSQSCQSADDFTAGGQIPRTSPDGKDSGTAWCYLNDNHQPVVLWTDDALHIMAWAVAPALDNWQALLDWFKTAGPE